MYVICYIHKWDRQIISVYNLRYVYILFMYIQCGFLCLKVHWHLVCWIFDIYGNVGVGDWIGLISGDVFVRGKCHICLILCTWICYIYNMIVCITLCRMKSIFEYGELNIHVAVYLFGSKGAWILKIWLEVSCYYIHKWDRQIIYIKLHIA